MAPKTATITVEPPSVAPGEEITAHGENLPTGEYLNLFWYDEQGVSASPVGLANADGTLDSTFRVYRSGTAEFRAPVLHGPKPGRGEYVAICSTTYTVA